jgi:hypothetical protein
MFFWGPIFGPGVIKKKGWLLRNRRFYFSCLVARSIKDPHQKLLKSRAQAKNKGLIPLLDDVPAKKIVLFCDGKLFSLDRSLLMGASIWNLEKFHITF